jgi:hypothetical protein
MFRHLLILLALAAVRARDPKHPVVLSAAWFDSL